MVEPVLIALEKEKAVGSFPAWVYTPMNGIAAAFS